MGVGGVSRRGATPLTHPRLSITHISSLNQQTVIKRRSLIICRDVDDLRYRVTVG